MVCEGCPSSWVRLHSCFCHHCHLHFFLSLSFSSLLCVTIYALPWLQGANCLLTSSCWLTILKLLRIRTTGNYCFVYISSSLDSQTRGYMKRVCGREWHNHFQRCNEKCILSSFLQLAVLCVASVRIFLPAASWWGFLIILPPKKDKFT